MKIMLGLLILIFGFVTYAYITSNAPTENNVGFLIYCPILVILIYIFVKGING